MEKLFTGVSATFYGNDITSAKEDIILEDSNGNKVKINMYDLIRFVAIRETVIESQMNQ